MNLENKIRFSSLLNWILTSFKYGAWAPILVFTSHCVAIFVFNIYRYFPWFDIPMHFVGGMAITYFFIESVLSAYNHKFLGKPSIITIILLIFLLTSTTTIFWEFTEWGADAFLGMHTQAGLDDTLLDMLLGMLGGLLAIGLRKRYILKNIK